MNRRIFVVNSLLLSGLAQGCLLTPGACDTVVPFVKVFNPVQEEGHLWRPEVPGSEIVLRSDGRIGAVEAVRTDRPWGAVYKNVVVDLERHPVLEINVLNVSKQWYLILSGAQFHNGYLRLVETRHPGHYSFFIPKMSRLSGLQTFDVKIGISDPGAQPLAGDYVFFDKLAFVAKEPLPGKPQAGPSLRLLPAARKAALANEKSVPVYDVRGRDIDAWKESAGEGPSEAGVSLENGVLTVRGKLADRNWGGVRKTVSVDLKRFPILEANVAGASRNWYLVVSHPRIPSGYLRLAESSNPGLQQFDIPKLTGLSGSEAVEVQVGVSRPESSTVKGEWVALDLLRFRGKNGNGR